MDGCNRPAGHGGFCVGDGSAAMLALVAEAENRYPGNLDAQRAFLRAALTPGARLAP